MSFPPPYRSYSFENAKADADPYSSPPISPKSTTSSTYSGSPLGTFDSPPLYSQRLREIAERNGHILHLDLNRPQQPRQPLQPPVVVVEKPSMEEDEGSYDEKDAEQINLLTATDLEEGIDFEFDVRTPKNNTSGGLPFWSSGRSSRRSKRVARWKRKFSQDDRELGWLTFIGIAVFVFLLMTVCGVLVAWSAGGHVSTSDLMAGKTYWVSSNAQAGLAAVEGTGVQKGEMDVQQLGSHFVIDAYTVEVVSSEKGGKSGLASH